MYRHVVGRIGRRRRSTIVVYYCCHVTSSSGNLRWSCVIDTDNTTTTITASSVQYYGHGYLFFQRQKSTKFNQHIPKSNNPRPHKFQKMKMRY